MLSSLYSGEHGPPPSLVSNVLERPTGFAWCVEKGGQVIAVSCLTIVLDEAEILDLRVSAYHRRAGVGRLLLGTILRDPILSEISDVFLEVRRSNVAAITLYQGLGFATIGVRESYYEAPGGREDALIMRRDSNKR